ncbi:probable monogalactosyldiacylglycerol synthase 3, chloroplastic [Triticum aestivum]|uniref:probable monogalactosyldiacylglycerol synthase 3, chloroplastic n=1 Tax=Triticum aestivum TaxID=4565 RepID=UPI001D0182EA|nr:probable monogalactosyldiacylglycerol synthase 3, chloroplastic [Triticum aestivum]
MAVYHHHQWMRRRFRKSLSYAGELAGPAGASSSSPSASLASLAGPEDDDKPFWDEEEGIVELVQFGANRVKTVLILMSDTNGGTAPPPRPSRMPFALISATTTGSSSRIPARTPPSGRSTTWRAPTSSW